MGVWGAHGDYLRALARKLCRSRTDADDLVQDVLVKVLRTPIPPCVNERAWLGRVMHNQFIDTLRRRQTRREEELVDAPVPVEPEAWWQTVSFDDVRAMVAQLPDEQRVTFEMFVIDGKSYDDIAEELAIAKATVGTRILRARQKLRLMLSSAGGSRRGGDRTSPSGAAGAIRERSVRSQRAIG